MRYIWLLIWILAVIVGALDVLAIAVRKNKRRW
jgi:hypothetical protein